MRFFVSWYEPVDESGDYRPLKWPLPKELKYWCTGSNFNQTEFTLCAVIDVNKEEDIEPMIKEFFNPKSWRFIDKKPDDWSPPKDRFPK